MKTQILLIRDIVANCHPFPPLFVIHIGSAIRDFGDQCKDKTTKLGMHPEDYELYHVGEWDDVTGNFHTPSHANDMQPNQIAVGKNYKD